MDETSPPMNKTLILPVILTIGLSAIIFGQYQTIQEQRATFEQLRETYDQQLLLAGRDRDELKRLREQNEIYRAEADSLRKKLSDVRAGAPASAEEGAATANAAGGVAPSSESGGFMKGIAKMFKDPEMKKAMRGQQAMGIRMMFGDLGKTLGLSPDETNQLMEMLIDRQMEATSAGMAMFDSEGKTEAEIAEAG